MLATAVKSIVRRLGYELSPRMDLDPVESRIIKLAQPFTLTSPERLLGLIDAVRYVCRSGIAGDIVECGVWRGGSIMAAAATLLAEGDSSRDLWLFDTFEGMTAPTAQDRDHRGNGAQGFYDRIPRWLAAAMDDVRKHVESTGYPAERLHFVAGPVEQTVPHPPLGRIAILRLDTDWYESTRHELVHLFPLLVEGGVLILDDVGHWQGARQAVEEYFRDHATYRPLLQRLDYTGRMAVKVSPRS
jgi:O-methyltransferase